MGRGGARQDREQRLAGQRAPGPQIGGLTDAPGGLGAADQRPVSDRMRQLAAQLLGGGLAGQLIDQRMFGCRDAPAQPLITLQRRQLVVGGQCVDVIPGHLVQRGIQRIKSRRHRPEIDNAG